MTSTQNNYYEILGVKKTASQEEIVKAYRKKMTQYHPDRHMNSAEDVLANAAEMTSQLNKAKAVLTDPEKRKLYDIGGEEAVNSGVHHRGRGNGGISNEDRNDYDIFHGYQNLKIPIDVSLKKLYTGTTIEHTFSRVSFCNKCNGLKTLDKNPKQCTKCSGKGSVKQMHPIFGMVIGPCDKCNNTGLDSSVEKCKKCKGVGNLNEEFTYSVKIPKGAHDGFPILVDDIGNIIPDKEDVRKYKQERANVVFIVREKPHKFFKRDKSILKPEHHKNFFADLVINIELTFIESIIGFERTYEHLDGKSFVIRIETLSKHNSVLIIENYGMPYEGSDTKYGDLFVSISIKNSDIKKTLSSGEKQKICQIFGLEYSPLGSAKSCDTIPIENKYNIELNTQSNDNDDDDEDNEHISNLMKGGFRAGTVQQCPMQ